MTSHLVGGPNATATSSISRRQSLAFACLSPELATASYHFAASRRVAGRLARFADRPLRARELGLRPDLDRRRGKVAEAFDTTVGEWLDRRATEQAKRGRTRQPSAQARKRLAYLCELLQLDEGDILDLLYQLLHRTAAAIL